MRMYAVVCEVAMSLSRRRHEQTSEMVVLGYLETRDSNGAFRVRCPCLYRYLCQALQRLLTELKKTRSGFNCLSRNDPEPVSEN